MQDPRTFETTLGDLLDTQADLLGDHEALVHVERNLRFTYESLRDECSLVARGMMALGIAKGHHVGIWATNYPEWIVAQVATAKIGAVLVTVNPAYRTHELKYVLRQSDADALILIGSFRTSDYVAMINKVVPELEASLPGEIKNSRLPRLRNLIFIPPTESSNAPGGHVAETPKGMWSWSAIREKAEEVTTGELAARQAECHYDDVINIQYTSGTTGSPKGAMLTHRNLVANATYSGEGLHFGHEDRLCIPVPFYHCFGCVLGVLLCVTAGSTIVIPAEYFDPEKTLVALEQEKCTAVHGVPTMFIAELAHQEFDRFDLTSLRTGIMAGSPCPIEVMRQVIDKMGARELTIAYGQTEASPVITMTDRGDPIERRVSTVGPALPGVEVKIVDPESGLEVPRETQGELLTRSFMVMKGYYKMPEASAEAVDQAGWLHTGDLATMDQDGYCKITGRLKDMLIRGGENVYPREIEEFFYTHPKVADVQVFGVPDQRLGEEVIAWIILKAGESSSAEEMREFCWNRIAHYKIPRHIKFVEWYPMTVTGKVQKFRMRELAIEELGLQGPSKTQTA